MLHPLRLSLDKTKGAFFVSRQKFDPDFKLRVVLEAIEAGNGSVVARRYELAPAVVNRWVRSYKEHGDGAFIPAKRRSRSGGGPDPRTQEVERENDQLKRLLGEKDLEIAILRDLVKKGTYR